MVKLKAVQPSGFMLVVYRIYENMVIESKVNCNRFLMLNLIDKARISMVCMYILICVIGILCNSLKYFIRII